MLSVIRSTTKALQEAGIESARIEAEMLLSILLNCSRESVITYDKDLTVEQHVRLKNLINRRSSGEPMAYISNERFFYGLRFYVNPSVLIPRPETELLVEVALKNVNSGKVLEVGTGSGCIAVSLAKNNQDIEVMAVEKSIEALKVAKRNVDTHMLGKRVSLIGSDFKTFSVTAEPESFELVVANPPYISTLDKNVAKDVRAFEPHTALYSGETGLECILEWAKLSHGLLEPRGTLVMEIGFDQGAASQEILKDVGYEDIELFKDLSNNDRVIKGVK